MTQGTEIWPEIIECGGNAYQHRGSVATAYAAIDGQGTVLTSSNQKNTGSGCCGCGSLATSAKYAANPLLAQLPIFAPTAFASSVTSANRANGSLAMADDATVGARLAGQGRNPGAETPRAGRSPSEEVQRTGRVSPTQQPTTRPATVATSPPAELRSDMHSTTIWSREPVVRILWTVGHDAEDSLAGYAIAWDQAPDTQPAATVNLPATTTDATSPLLTTGRWYAHLATVDRAGNADAVVHAGPFLVDVAAPVWPDGAADTEAVWHNVVAPPRFTWPAAVDEGAGMAGYRVTGAKTRRVRRNRRWCQPAYAPPALSAESTASVRYLRVRGGGCRWQRRGLAHSRDLALRCDPANRGVAHQQRR